jgi:hypothetical protein
MTQSRRERITPLSADHPTPPAAPGIKPWLETPVREPLVRFHCDDGKVYCAQHHRLSAVYDEADQRLEVQVPPHGCMVVRGLGTGALCEALCGGRATAIRCDGKAITSVTLLAEAKAEAAAWSRAKSLLLAAEPDDA